MTLVCDLFTVTEGHSIKFFFSCSQRICSALEQTPSDLEKGTVISEWEPTQWFHYLLVQLGSPMGNLLR